MISRYAVGLTAAAAALVLAGTRLARLLRLIASGTSAPGRTRGWAQSLRAEVREVIFQTRLLRWTVPGIAHAVVFWGFVVLLLTIVEAAGELFSPAFAIPGIGHLAVIGLLEDATACAVLIGVGVFAVLRMTGSPSRRGRTSRFYGSHTGAAWLVLAGIALVIVTLLVYRGAAANTGDLPYGSWAFASHGIADAFRSLGGSTNRTIETVFLDANVVVICAFLIFVTYSKHLHIFLAPFNVAFARHPRALGALGSTLDMDPELLSENSSFGVGTIAEFTWKQLLDFATCTECGRCQSRCPAWATGKALSPKLLVMGLRDEMLSSNTKGAGLVPPFRSLVPTVIEPEVLWACTTCGACVEECPVDIEHVDAIVDMRRHEVLMKAVFPSEAAAMLRRIETRGDPFGLGPQSRLEWTDGLGFDVPIAADTMPEDAEYLFWVGCAGALDERARRTTRAIATLLHRAGVGFAVLGPRETCTGDPARRLGNEYLFQTQARQVIDTMDDARVRKVVASCPHCFNTIANEYPDLGGSYEVLHHTELLARLIGDGRLESGRLEESVTYHDPCYLGRHNRVFDEPRSVIDALDGIERFEMGRNRENAFCCGAGGARMWMEEDSGGRINANRAEEAIATGAAIVGTACPYCLVMLDDAMKARGDEAIEVLDVAQLLERATRRTTD